MNKPNFFNLTVILPLFLFCAVALVSAQTTAPSPVESGFEVTFQVLSGTNDSNAVNNLPASLSGAAKKIKENFQSNNLRLVSTYYERCGANAGIEHKGLFNQPASNIESAAPSFSEWSLGGLNAANTAAGQPVIQFKYFRFGTRIPVSLQISGNDAEESSKKSIAYESIGLTINQVNVPENAPTVIGSMETSKAGEVLFFVLTVKSAKS